MATIPAEVVAERFEWTTTTQLTTEIVTKTRIRTILCNDNGSIKVQLRVTRFMNILCSLGRPEGSLLSIGQHECWSVEQYGMQSYLEAKALGGLQGEGLNASSPSL